jgi:hypothetical protein
MEPNKNAIERAFELAQTGRYLEVWEIKECLRYEGYFTEGITGPTLYGQLKVLAAQLLAAHNATMECHRRAMLGEQTFEGRRENLSQANKLSRTYAVLLDALNRHRGKGQQKVTVEHVHVHAGGQAVVGTIETPGGGDRVKSEEQPHALTYEPGTPVRSAYPEGQLVPSARDAERAL